jgi:hypothetical protein
MNPITETSIIAQHGTVVASGGTVTSTGVDFTPTYESQAKFVLDVAANSAGAVVATIESGTALASGYETVGTISAGTVPGIYSVDVDCTVGRYLRSTITSSSGTAVVAANVIAKRRTLT